MKEVLRAIGATIGFMGLAGLVLFVFETAGTGTFNPPSGNLTADIASNNPVGTINDARTAAADETAIISNAAPQTNPAPPPTAAPASPSSPSAPTQGATAPASPPTPARPATPPPAASSLAPLPDAGAAVTSTDATTSV